MLDKLLNGVLSDEMYQRKQQRLENSLKSCLDKKKELEKQNIKIVSRKQRLEEIYAQYGRYLNKVDSYEFPGLTGMDKMAGIMQNLRDNAPTEFAGHRVVKVTDYQNTGETGLPSANVLIYSLEGGASVVVRPSGTEPKIKTYFTTLGKDLAEAQAQKDALTEAIRPLLA